MLLLIVLYELWIQVGKSKKNKTERECCYPNKHARLYNTEKLQFHYITVAILLAIVTIHCVQLHDGLSFQESMAFDSVLLYVVNFIKKIYVL